jgi:error-prone DNA polymerase
LNLTHDRDHVGRAPVCSVSGFSDRLLARLPFPTPELEKVLGKTLGVPLFQEQAMQVAMVAAGFSPSEADQLRRAMATFKFTGGVDKFRDMLIRGMLDNG